MYGYFRDIMDSGFYDDITIKVIREMILNRVNESRDLPQEFIDEMIEKHELNLEDYPAFLPDIAVSLLRKYNHCYIGGGGRSECLREITLFMNALNIKYKEMRKFIY